MDGRPPCLDSNYLTLANVPKQRLSEWRDRDLYKAVGALPAVEPLRHAEGEGFRGVACP